MALTSWYVDAARRRLHEAVGDLLVVGIGDGGSVVGALLRVAGVEVVDLVPRQVRLTQLKGSMNSLVLRYKFWQMTMINPYLERRAHGGGGIAAVPHEAVSVSAAAEEAGVPTADPVERAACKSGERMSTVSLCETTINSPEVPPKHKRLSDCTSSLLPCLHHPSSIQY